MMLTVEQLMQPRYKVISDYPGSRFIKDEILVPFDESFSQDKDSGYLIDIPDAYPHLFKRLEWWEDRDEKDLPEYVQLKDKSFRKIAEYIPLGKNYWAIKTDRLPGDEWDQYYIDNLLPATLEQYTEYINQKQ